jgi:hypothetical protein
MDDISLEVVNYSDKTVEEKRNIASKIINLHNQQANYEVGDRLINVYFPIVEHMGDRNVDPFESKPLWKQVYFDGIEFLKNEDVNKGLII